MATKKGESNAARKAEIDKSASVAGGVEISGDITDSDIKIGSRQINTGGGSYIEGSVETGGGDFVGRDQVVYTGAQEGITLDQFTELLEQIQDMLPGAGLDEDAVEEINYDIERIGKQATKPEPSGDIILKRLSSIMDFLIQTATVAAAAPQLIDAVRQATAWAEQLFR